MPARTPIVVGHWQLHHDVDHSLALVTELHAQLGERTGVDIGVAPVFTALQAVAKRLEGTGIFVAAQNCFWDSAGAWTGEVSPPLLRDVGCSHVVLGHSERRQHFGETDDDVRKKVDAALREGLDVIACVGETEAERDAGHTTDRVATQLDAAIAEVAAADASRVVVAYEPVWAIGTGRTATPDQAQEMHRFIRDRLRDHYGDAAERMRIQYGGSVKPGNAKELMQQPDIDGALVGGASLDAASFAAIVQAAAEAGR